MKERTKLILGWVAVVVGGVGTVVSLTLIILDIIDQINR